MALGNGYDGRIKCINGCVSPDREIAYGPEYQLKN
jgi:hypothetical protein